MYVPHTPYTRDVYYYETDQMGIVHHSNYIRWMEEARQYLIRTMGLCYQSLEQDGILMVVTDLSCHYAYSVPYGESIQIYPNLTYFNGVRAMYQYKIYTGKTKQLAATGKSSHCFVDHKTRIPVNLKKREPKFYETVMALMKEERQ